MAPLWQMRTHEAAMRCLKGVGAFTNPRLTAQKLLLLLPGQPMADVLLLEDREGADGDRLAATHRLASGVGWKWFEPEVQRALLAA